MVIKSLSLRKKDLSRRKRTKGKANKNLRERDIMLMMHRTTRIRKPQEVAEAVWVDRPEVDPVVAEGI